MTHSWLVHCQSIGYNYRLFVSSRTNKFTFCSYCSSDVRVSCRRDNYFVRKIHPSDTRNWMRERAKLKSSFLLLFSIKFRSHWNSLPSQFRFFIFLLPFHASTAHLGKRTKINHYFNELSTVLHLSLDCFRFSWINWKSCEKNFLQKKMKKFVIYSVDRIANWENVHFRMNGWTLSMISAAPRKN